MVFGTDRDKASVSFYSGFISHLIDGYRIVLSCQHQIKVFGFLTFKVISYYSGNNTQTKYRTICQLHGGKRVHIATVEMFNQLETTDF